MEPADSVRHACGIVSVCAGDDDAFFARLAGACRETPMAFALVFFSKARMDPETLAARFAGACPQLRYAACSTAGEITHAGLTEGSMAALLFPAGMFTVEAVRIGDIVGAGIEGIVSQVAEARTRFLRKSREAEDRGVFALCLIDGLSFAEEPVTAALHWGLDDIPLIGGSAGDDMGFRETSLILDGTAGNGCAILMLVGTKAPFHIFKTDNFVPTAKKLVVTRSDPDRRMVMEFNAAPAAEEYARVIGMAPSSLSPMSFASHPLVVRVGGEYYCRSVQKMNSDGSLSFYCAIDDGIVMTVAEPTGMARATRDAFDEVRRKVGAIDLVIGFDCVLRQIDARNRQVTQVLSSIYRENHVIGFNTYGEQYISMHLNQTFTGIAFVHPREGAAA